MEEKKYYVENMFFEKPRKESPFRTALKEAIGKRKLKNISWEIEKIRLFDFYRFFKKFGVVQYSAVAMNGHWGPYFKEAVILLGDLVVAVKINVVRDYICTIHHRNERKIKALWDELDSWSTMNSVLRGEQFMFPSLARPKMKNASFMNDSVKRTLEDNTILFFKKLKQLRRHGIKVKRGIVLYGNPGNGKTSICRWISKNLPGVTRIWVTDWDMRPSAVSAIFEIARKLSPSIIFLEDIDTIGMSRHLSGGINSFLGKLLNEMDGIQRNDGIVVIATTNNISVLDAALANRPGRFDLKLKVGNPHPRIIRQITGSEDDITLAEAFRRKDERIFYEKILGRKYRPRMRRETLHYIG